MTAPSPARVAWTAALGLGVIVCGLACTAADAGAARVRHAPARAPAPHPAGAAAASRSEPTDAWHAARTLADSARFDDALALLRRALARQGDDFGLRWLQAGITGEAGRHSEAVELYLRLSADHPERADDLLDDLAEQRLEAGDPRGALLDVRRRLSRSPGEPAARRTLALALARADSLRPALAEYDSLLAESPGDVDLALDRARVLGWMGRHRQAIAAYRAILARDSTNAEARLGEAMNENWAGRHRLATHRLEAIVRQPGADPEATKALAFARYWDGDADGARSALDAYLHRAPDDAEAQQLSRTLARERAARLRFEGGRSDDSDGLRVLGSGMELSGALSPATTARVLWHRDNVRDAGGTQDPLRVAAGLSHAFGPSWTAHGEIARLDWGDGPGTTLGGEAGLVSRPVDGVRLEGVVERAPVLTRRSLALGISLLEWVGAADLSPSEAVSLHVDGHAGYYSDGNGLERLDAAARWRAWSFRRAELALTLAAAQLEVHFDPDHGYYAPALHQEGGPGAELQWHPQQAWTITATASTGAQRDRGDVARPLYSAEGRIEYAPVPAWTFDLSGGRSDSNLQSASGYRRSWWLAGVSRAF